MPSAGLYPPSGHPTEDRALNLVVLVKYVPEPQGIPTLGEDFLVVREGVEATDGSTGTLPMTVAELLEIPSATFARKVEVIDGSLRAERQTEAGYDVVESPLPALATVTGSAAEPRYPTLKGIMQSKQKPVEQLSLADLGLSTEDVAPSQQVTSVKAATQKGPGEVIDAGDEAVARIADILADAKVI